MATASAPHGRDRKTPETRRFPPAWRRSPSPYSRRTWGRPSPSAAPPLSAYSRGRKAAASRPPPSAEGRPDHHESAPFGRWRHPAIAGSDRMDCWSQTVTWTLSPAAPAIPARRGKYADTPHRSERPASYGRNRSRYPRPAPSGDRTAAKTADTRRGRYPPAAERPPDGRSPRSPGYPACGPDNPGWSHRPPSPFAGSCAAPAVFPLVIGGS